MWAASASILLTRQVSVMILSLPSVSVISKPRFPLTCPYFGFCSGGKICSPIDLFTEIWFAEEETGSIKSGTILARSRGWRVLTTLIKQMARLGTWLAWFNEEMVEIDILEVVSLVPVLAFYQNSTRNSTIYACFRGSNLCPKRFSRQEFWTHIA